MDKIKPIFSENVDTGETSYKDAQREARLRKRKAAWGRVVWYSRNGAYRRSEHGEIGVKRKNIVPRKVRPLPKGSMVTHEFFDEAPEC